MLLFLGDRALSLDAYREVLWPSRCLERSIIQPPPSFFLSVKPKRSLRMHPTRSGGMRESKESAVASRSALRIAAEVPPTTSSNFLIEATRAICTASHSIQPPTRFSNMFCCLLAFSACPRRLMS